MARRDRTCWRGLQLDHPGDWEVAVASGVDDPGRIILADRYNQRLEIQWKPLKFVPNMDLILDKHRQHEGRKVDFSESADAPPPWRAIVHPLEKSGSMVHAGRFFREQRLLVEATLLWPSRRDVNMEKEVLASITPADPQAPVRLWQAMGLSVTIGKGFNLVKSDPKVGRIRWDFATDSKDDPDISVERIAIYDAWLKVPLREWLVSELPDGHEILRQDVIDVGPHRAEQLISSAHVGKLAYLRGSRRDRLDRAWLCPVEGRAYRVSAGRSSRRREIALPDDLAVRCCRETPQVAPSGR